MRCPTCPAAVSITRRWPASNLACPASGRLTVLRTQVVAVRRDVALPNLAGSRLEHLALACRELRLDPWPAAPLPATLTSLHVLLEVRSRTRRRAGSPRLRSARTPRAHISCMQHT